MASDNRSPKRHGRPADAEEPRTEELRVRLTPREKQRLFTTARRLGMDVAELVRRKLEDIIGG